MCLDARIFRSEVLNDLTGVASELERDETEVHIFQRGNW